MRDSADTEGAHSANVIGVINVDAATLKLTRGPIRANEIVVI